MKKILSVLLGLALCCMLAVLPVCAEEAAVETAEEVAIEENDPVADEADFEG